MPGPGPSRPGRRYLRRNQVMPWQTALYRINQSSERMNECMNSVVNEQVSVYSGQEFESIQVEFHQLRRVSIDV